MHVLVTGGAVYIGSVVVEELLRDGHRVTIYDLGCGGDGYSVKEVIDLAHRITGKAILTKIVPRRSGDPAVLIASSEAIKRDLGWFPQFQSLELIIESAWSWLRSQQAEQEQDSQVATAQV